MFHFILICGVLFSPRCKACSKIGELVNELNDACFLCHAPKPLPVCFALHMYFPGARQCKCFPGQRFFHQNLSGRLAEGTKHNSESHALRNLTLFWAYDLEGPKHCSWSLPRDGPRECHVRTHATFGVF